MNTEARVKLGKCTVRIKGPDGGFHDCNQNAGHKGPHSCSHYPEGFPKGCIIYGDGKAEPGKPNVVVIGKIE
jgi:hypothetical protein